MTMDYHQQEMVAFDALPKSIRDWLNANGLPARMAQALWQRWPYESSVITMLEQAKAQAWAGITNITLTPPPVFTISTASTSSTATTIRYW